MPSLHTLHKIQPDLNLTVMQVTAKLAPSYGTHPQILSPQQHTYLPLNLSNDDHSYFVRWKLPTETLEVFDDNKWLRLSSSTIIHLAIVITGLEYLAD